MQMFHVSSPKLPGSLLLQRPCHERVRAVVVAIALSAGMIIPAYGVPPAHDYPTQARVEYVNDCVARNGGKLSQVYQCSCVIDDIANTLDYDAFVEVSTFAHYATLPGERGGEFRDSDEAKAKAKQFRDLEKNAYRACGLEGAG